MYGDWNGGALCLGRGQGVFRAMTGFIIALVLPLAVGMTTYSMDRDAIVAVVWGAGIEGCFLMLVAAGKI